MAAVIPVEIDKHLSSDKVDDIVKFLDGQLTSLINSHTGLFNDKLSEWQRIYKGIPKYESRTFPWKNASNVVIQVIGQHTDTLLATILSQMFDVLPIYPVTITGDWPEETGAEEQRDALEEYLNYVALETDELDLYRVYSRWFGGAIKYGDMTLKSPYVCEYEGIVGTESGSGLSIAERIKYEGPRPEVIPFQDFFVTPNATTVEQADFKAHRIILKKYQLEDRRNAKVYPSAKIDKVLTYADRGGPSTQERERLEQQGITGGTSNDDSSEYDIYECYFSFWVNSYKVRLICTYHKQSQTLLKGVFNWYPKNNEPFRMARLGYTEDGIRGLGFCEMLKHYQEEISSGHNQRVDNRTLANCSILRVDPASRLDAHIGLYPMATIPGAKDQIEVMQLGSIHPESSNVEGEMLTLKLASDRTGVDPAPSGPGLGTGTVGKTSGVYSAMSSYQTAQERNKRMNMNTTDMKYSHIRLGRTMTDIYAEFGIGSRLDLFGKKSEFLNKALQSYKDGKLGFGIRFATASINKETEKQNNLLLTTILQRHYTSIGQIIQAVNNPQIVPELRDYLIGVMKGSDQLMKRILQDFGYEDQSKILPEPASTKKGNVNGQQPAYPQLPNGGFSLGQTVPGEGNGSQVPQ